MKVSVFTAPDDGLLQDRYLVLPAATKAKIPSSLGTGWLFFGTLESKSSLFRGIAVELHLQLKGYVLVTPPASGIWS
jgi:hypothetical protein